MDVAIIHEDSDILVVDKPSGMTVNKSETTKGDTLQDWAENYLHIPTENWQVENVDTLGSLDTPDVFYKRAGIAHRLDKETSGVLLIAKNPKSFFQLLRQFRERTVEKSYTALVHGKVTPEVGNVTAPVGRQEWNRKRFGVVAGGRDAVTDYKVIGSYQNGSETLSLLSLFPKTGRTHQIRVHMKYVNHPLFSDELYGGRKTARNDRKKLPRLFLHASKITFLHPDGHQVHFESVLPKDLQTVIDQLTPIAQA